MAPTYVGYDIVTSRKSDPNLDNPDKTICRQIDELQRISSYERDKSLGKEYFDDVEEFFNLEDSNTNFPSFRPRVRIPQLQTLVLNEATDITDSSPKVFINFDGNRDEAREKYFQSNWKQGCYNNRILEAFVWAMLSNLGFCQLGFDPYARKGHGSTWVQMRHPKSVYPDPYCTSDKDWSFLVLEDWLYIDEVHRRWPDKGRLVRPHLYDGPADPYGATDSALEFPEASPLSAQGINQQRKIFKDNRVRVRQCFCFDTTREKVQDAAGTKAISADIVHPRYQYTYPDGRWLTECEGVVLADGNNWCPQLPDDSLGTFPLVRILAMPAITNFWGPPPIKLTRSLQDLSEKIYTQTFENIVRTSNGVIVIKANSGLDAQQIGWLPGEVLTINPGAEPPQVIAPQALPQHMTQVPASLLALQKELQGFSQSRQGNPGSGNISPELFDDALHQAQTMTRLRGRLLSESIQRLAYMIFYIESRYKQLPDKRFSGVGADAQARFVDWKPIDDADSYDIMLDENSLQIMSANALRSTMLGLAKANKIPDKALLESLDIPHADEIAEENMRQLELSAMGKLKRPR